MNKAAIFSVFERERHGIARYPIEEARSMQSEGWEVQLVGLTRESGGIRNFDLRVPRDCLAFLAFILSNRWERISFHFYHGFVFPYLGKIGEVWKNVVRLLQFLSLMALGVRNPESTVIIHEIPLGKVVAGFRRLLFGYSLARFKRVEVFTPAVRERLLNTFPMLVAERVVVVDHGRHMKPLFHGSREEARMLLGIEQSGIMFLCIGFWGPQKGFDAAIRAIRKLSAPLGTLWIVGSLNGDSEDLVRHRNLLMGLSTGADSVKLVERYIPDEEFDAWIKAANAVVLPYRGVLNSSVGARAAIAGTPLWISDLPELISQFPGATVFHGEEGLSRLFMGCCASTANQQHVHVPRASGHPGTV